MNLMAMENTLFQLSQTIVDSNGSYAMPMKYITLVQVPCEMVCNHGRSDGLASPRSDEMPR